LNIREGNNNDLNGNLMVMILMRLPCLNPLNGYRKSYTSDVSKEQWLKIKNLLPLTRKGAGRPLEIDMREAANAIFYALKTGCQWENLPHDFLNYQSVFYHYNKWCKDGTWEKINRALRYESLIQEGRSPHPSAAIIDSQSINTNEVGGDRNGRGRITGR